VTLTLDSVHIQGSAAAKNERLKDLGPLRLERRGCRTEGSRVVEAAVYEIVCITVVMLGF